MRREKRFRRFGCHEIGEAFLEPQIVEPPHRDGVAEPLVRGLVEQELRAREDVRFVRRGWKQHRILAQKGGPGVLHASVSELRDENQVVFWKRKTRSEGALEPAHRLAIEPQHLWGLGPGARELR